LELSLKLAFYKGTTWLFNKFAWLFDGVIHVEAVFDSHGRPPAGQ
jgi:hypothetical protein